MPKHPLLLAMPFIFAPVLPAAASDPWPTPMSGCIRRGAFISDNGGYVIQVRDRIDGPNHDWSSMEDRHVSFGHGSLLPSDIYIPDEALRDDGPCQ